MRQLFVPACLCLVTWSGSTGSNPKISLDEFYGVSVVEKTANAPASTTGAAPAAEDNPASQDETAENLAAPSDIPIDIPVQTGVERALEPERIPLPPVPKPVVHRSRQEVCDTLAKAAETNELPVPFFIRLLFQESRFQPEVVSRAGAEGVAQFMPETSASVGLANPFDPLQAIPASARLLRDLFHQFGNLGLAAAAYNAGPKRIADWLAKKGKLPQETQGYVKTITGRPAENWKIAAAGVPEIRLPRRAPCQEEAGLHAWNGPDHIPLPAPSPTRIAEASASAAKLAAASAATIKHHAARVTATIKIEKPASASAAKDETGAMQLAARKSTPTKTRLAHKAGAAAHKAANKPLEIAAAAGGVHK
jgi:hypothetical protein